MVYEFYADVYFLTNFIMDFMILYCTVKLAKQTATCFRLILGAALGAMLAVMTVIYPIKPIWVQMVFDYFVIGAVMVYVGTKPSHLNGFVKNYVFLFMTAFISGGGFTAIYYYTNVGYYLQSIQHKGFLKEMGTTAFICTAVVTYFIMKWLIVFVQHIKQRQNHMLETEVILGTHRVKCFGLLDTGNCLFEPISHKPVIVGTYAFLERLLPNEDKKRIFNIVEHGIGACTSGALLCQYGLKMIPYSSVGKQKGFMVGITVDQVIVYTKGKENKVQNQIIAISKTPVSVDRCYEIILHSALF